MEYHDLQINAADKWAYRNGPVYTFVTNNLSQETKDMITVDNCVRFTFRGNIIKGKILAIERFAVMPCHPAYWSNFGLLIEKVNLNEKV